VFIIAKENKGIAVYVAGKVIWMFIINVI